ncbi:hypothetical protein [Streptomyces sp. NPDC055681]
MTARNPGTVGRYGCSMGVGDAAVIRFVYKQLAYAAAGVLAGVTALGVTVAVKGGLRMDYPWEGFAAIFAWTVLMGFVSTSKLKKLGDVPLFEAAVPIADPATVLSVPARARARRSLGGFFGAMFAPSFVVVTVLALFEPMVALLSCIFAVEPLMRAERAARWERRQGVVLWQGHVEQEQQPADTGQPPVFISPRRAGHAGAVGASSGSP